MSTDRELLEMAAKAAGRSIKWDGNVAVLRDFEPGVDECSAWHPLDDDGDALRLAVKLRLDITQMDMGGKQVLRVLGPASVDRTYEITEDDPYAATRRAIVGAAAAIGKAMP